MSNFILPYPNIASYGRPTQRHLDWLLAAGVPLRALTRPPMVLLAHGHKAADGCFEDDPDGEEWLVFPEADDVVYWEPKSGQKARWNNRCFALGQDMIDAAGTFALDGCLRIFQDPLAWLLANRSGIVIVDWSQTFVRLGHCPRLAVAEELHDKLKRHLRPPHLPEIFIMREREAVTQHSHRRSA